MINQAKKALILGAEGNLGSQLARVMGNDYRLLLWDREDVDVTDFELLKEMISEHKPDIILNCVAYNAVDLCEEDDVEYEKALVLNRDLPGELADIALPLGSTLVHFLSDYVFDGEQKKGYKEDAGTRAVSRYGESKLQGERVVLQRAGDGLKYYLVRTSKLFGPKGPSDSAKESFFDLILRLSAEKQEFKMIDGEEISCFTYTPDLARAVLGMIETEKKYGIYHIVNEGSASWYEGAKYMFELKGVKDVELIPSNSSDYPRPAKRPRYSVLINTKLPKLRNYKEALKEYLKK